MRHVVAVVMISVGANGTRAAYDVARSVYTPKGIAARGGLTVFTQENLPLHVGRYLATSQADDRGTKVLECDDIITNRAWCRRSEVLIFFLEI